MWIHLGEQVGLNFDQDDLREMAERMSSDNWLHILGAFKTKLWLPSDHPDSVVRSKQ